MLNFTFLGRLSIRIWSRDVGICPVSQKSLSEARHWCQARRLEKEEIIMLWLIIVIIIYVYSFHPCGNNTGKNPIWVFTYFWPCGVYHRAALLGCFVQCFILFLYLSPGCYVCPGDSFGAFLSLLWAHDNNGRRKTCPHSTQTCECSLKKWTESLFGFNVHFVIYHII